MSCITMILNRAFICKLFKKNKIFKADIIKLKYCKWCRYKFKQHLTLAIKVWTCYPIDTAVINAEKKGWNLSMSSQLNGCGFTFSYTLTTARFSVVWWLRWSSGTGIAKHMGGGVVRGFYLNLNFNPWTIDTIDLNNSTHICSQSDVSAYYSNIK